MKTYLFLISFVFTLFLTSCKTSNNNSYKDFPLIVAENEVIDYRVGENWFYGEWSIAPEVENDTLSIVCHAPVESFLFKTDKDSIAFQIQVGSIERFYVLLNDSAYAHTIIQGVPFETQKIEFDTKDKNDEIKIEYQKEKSAYLEQLKEEYPLSDLLDAAETDTEKVLNILNWTSSRWQHDGNNSPQKNDAISILKEAEEGKRFPCFAFAIVLRDQLNALGYKARTLFIRIKEAQESQYPSSHVITEVYLNDLGKWVFLDAQFNVMPVLHGTPLNAIELQQAITNNYQDLEFLSLNKTYTKDYYIDFVYSYLFYIETSLDHQYDIDKPQMIDGKRALMLVPVGAENLSRLAFYNVDIDYCFYTNSIRDFYAKPE